MDPELDWTPIVGPTDKVNQQTLKFRADGGLELHRFTFELSESILNIMC